MSRPRAECAQENGPECDWFQLRGNIVPASSHCSGLVVDDLCSRIGGGRVFTPAWRRYPARMKRPLVHHIPVCPFSQRLEILLALKGAQGAVDFTTVDVTRPRDPHLLAKTRGVTALPVLETEDGSIIRESLVIARYLDERFGPPVARDEPYARAVENMLIAMEGEFATAGYRFVMNANRDKRADFSAAMDAQYARLDDYLRWQAPDRVFLFDSFGLAEAVFTPLFVRFHFLDYYEGYDIPARPDAGARMA